jgi:hypothetical protein
VLRRLEKGHTRSDVVRAVGMCREAGLTLTPTFVAFTPWTTIESYRQMLREIAALDLVDAVASIQLAIRLLVTTNSRLLELDDIRRAIGPFDTAALAYPWRHDDPAVDHLQRAVSDHIGRRVGRSRTEVFREVWALACGEALAPFPPGTVRMRADVPWLDEPWYC